MPRFERGVLYLDDEPTFLLSGDYPYYRDDRENWRPRLRAIRNSGIRIVTTYVPWRHHAPRDPICANGSYDFEGSTQANRDVIGFLRACHEEGLLAIVKPGPFVHAELKYGGLPDYVDPSTRADIEPELDALGVAWKWVTRGRDLEQSRLLPAPLDETFLRYVRGWFSSFAREVAAPLAAPLGPIIAIQLMNEGIYSDSASGLITTYGYSASSQRAWWRFLQRKYGDVTAYDRAHGTSIVRWEDAAAPTSVGTPARLRDLLTCLDWSEFSHALYMNVIETYVTYLREAGLDPRLPILVNFCPNSNSYRTHVASNDGWYSKVAWHPRMGVQWGYTNWLGVVEREPRAFLQYVLAGTRERGPNVEENWGFSDIYDPAYAYTQPSYFQSLLFLAAGATGLNAYTMVGTRAWRSDVNLAVAQIPRERVEIDLDYPAHPPVASDGRLLPKYWTLAQIAHHMSAEGASLVGERRADIAWGVYPPYAWAGAWAPGGDSEEGPWLEAGLRAMPRVAYHGLEAFLEASLASDNDVAQVNLLGAELAALRRFPLIVLAGYDYMDAETQDLLADYVHEGGSLLLTGLVPRLDERLEPFPGGPLRARVFDHGAERLDRLDPNDLIPVHLDEGDEPIGLASNCVVRPKAPNDAFCELRSRAGVSMGYAVRRGRGTGIYAGFHPWFSAASGDDLRLVAGNQDFVARIAAALTPARSWHARAERRSGGGGEVNVWQYGAFQPARTGSSMRPPAADVEHLVVVSRAAMPHLAHVRFFRSAESEVTFRVALAPHTACLVTFEHGKARSFLLKCVNDHDAIAIPPRLDEPGGAWAADTPCDLCVTRVSPTRVEVSVANAVRRTVSLRIPLEAGRILRIDQGQGHPVAFEAATDGITFDASDQAFAGVYVILLRPLKEETTKGSAGLETAR